MTSDYSTLPGFSGVYLEDSFVLSIDEQPQQFSFELEAVLRPEHPDYHPPLPGEQFCYADARLIFDDVSDVEWLARSTRRYTDASGNEDLGNIDSLIVEEQDCYLIEGDWGRVRIRCPRAPRMLLPH
ncbi:hypothetical protein [Rhodococcus triatomae]|nr:hypothetical protein G419_05472 [Rhodococcus triatomae BKS 15-14]